MVKYEVRIKKKIYVKMTSRSSILPSCKKTKLDRILKLGSISRLPYTLLNVAAAHITGIQLK